MKKLLLLVFVVFLISCTDKNSRQLEDHQNQKDSLLSELDAMRLENDSLLKENRKIQIQSNLPKDSVSQIFRERTDLIPMEAVLGGTMQFGNIEVIENGLIVADYNDGHIEGSSLFKYEKIEDSLNFKLLYQLSN